MARFFVFFLLCTSLLAPLAAQARGFGLSVRPTYRTEIRPVGDGPREAGEIVEYLQM